MSKDDNFRNLIPIFGNDHFTWMLESYIDERNASDSGEYATENEEWEKTLVAECKASTIDGVSSVLCMKLD